MFSSPCKSLNVSSTVFIKGTWEPDLLTCFTKSNWDNGVSIMTRIQAGQLKNYDLIPGHGKRF